MIINTCQVCGRVIRLVKGRGELVIAHHGYKRPGVGALHGTCLGARYLPYERSRTRIDDVLQGLRDHLKRLSDTLKGHIECPPPQLIEFPRDYGRNRNARKRVFDRPPGFVAPEQHPYTYHQYDYAGHHDRLRIGYLSQIREAEQTIAYLEKRYRDWTPPKETA